MPRADCAQGSKIAPTEPLRASGPVLDDLLDPGSEPEHLDLVRLRARAALFDLVHSQLGEVRLSIERVRELVEVEDSRLMRLAQIVEGLGKLEAPTASWSRS